MREGYKRFYYKGPVMEFEKIISNNWSGFTEAPSKSKALNNLKFRFKKEMKLEAYAKISLDEKYIKEI